MARITVPLADKILDTEFRVLDKGFVRLVDYMGSDARIVQSARVSYGAGTKTKREDAGLINYLMKNAHTSPFEQVVLTFHMKLPIFVARQMVRHRTARLNEMSLRYSEAPNEFYNPDRWRAQSKTNKQGSDAAELEHEQLSGQLMTQAIHAMDTYRWMIDQGAARELARMVLPIHLYTQWYWQMDLHNLFHFLRLRLDAHAQFESRAYAKVMATMASAVAPMAYEAFETHVLDSVKLSRAEVEAISGVVVAKDVPTKRFDAIRRKLGLAETVRLDAKV